VTICYFSSNLFAQDPMDLPGNKALTREIGRLREKWQCHSTSCGQSHCYVHPNEKTHFPLSHTHFNVWGSAIVSINYNCIFFIDIKDRSRGMTRQLLKALRITKYLTLPLKEQKQSLQLSSNVAPLRFKPHHQPLPSSTSTFPQKS
jgi:hypothetical protein